MKLYYLHNERFQPEIKTHSLTTSLSLQNNNNNNNKCSYWFYWSAKLDMSSYDDSNSRSCYSFMSSSKRNQDYNAKTTFSGNWSTKIFIKKTKNLVQHQAPQPVACTKLIQARFISSEINKSHLYRNHNRQSYMDSFTETSNIKVSFSFSGEGRQAATPAEKIKHRTSIIWQTNLEGWCYDCPSR